jgi:hypothetical protein
MTRSGYLAMIAHADLIIEASVMLGAPRANRI